MILETGLLFNHVIKSAHNRAGMPPQPQNTHVKVNLHETLSTKSGGTLHPKNSNYGHFWSKIGRTQTGLTFQPRYKKCS